MQPSRDAESSNDDDYILLLDSETDQLVPADGDLTRLRVTVACCLAISARRLAEDARAAVSEGRRCSFWHAEAAGRRLNQSAPLLALEELLVWLDEALAIVAYHAAFDVRVLANEHADEARFAFHSSKIFDPLLHLRSYVANAPGGEALCLKLSALLSANGLAPKTSTGKQAVSTPGLKPWTSCLLSTSRSC